MLSILKVVMRAMPVLLETMSTSVLSIKKAQHATVKLAEGFRNSDSLTKTLRSH